MIALKRVNTLSTEAGGRGPGALIPGHPGSLIPGHPGSPWALIGDMRREAEGPVEVAS